MNKSIFLIKELWIDPMENRVAHGYKTIGYMTNKESAKDFCSKGRIFTGDDCWSLEYCGDLPQYHYKQIKEMEK